jgi:mono/diheme cytochrome c family protein
MKKHALKSLLIASVVVWLDVAAQAQDIDVGKSEFRSSCATCHGDDAKGKGPLSEELKTAPPDLTVLSKNNGGVFPFNSIYAAIYGTKVIIAHGTRDMPIWGNRFTTDPVSTPSNRNMNLAYDTDAVVRARIVALIDYLNRIQQK